jgi:hypothetical protein
MSDYTFCEHAIVNLGGGGIDFVNDEFASKVVKNIAYRKETAPEARDFIVPLPAQSKVDVFFDDTQSLFPRGESIERGVVQVTGSYSTPVEDGDIELLNRQKTFVNKDSDKNYFVTYSYPDSHGVAGYRIRPLNKSDGNYDIDVNKIIVNICHVPNVSRQDKILTYADKIKFAEKTIQVPKIYTSFIHSQERTVLDEGTFNFTGTQTVLMDNGVIYDVPGLVDLDTVRDAEGIWIPRGYEMVMECGDSQLIRYGPYDHGVLLDLRMFPTEKISELNFTQKTMYSYTPIFDQNILESFTTRSGECLVTAAEVRNRPCIIDSPHGHLINPPYKYGSVGYQYFTPKFLDNNKYLTSNVNSNKSIGIIVPPFLALNIGGSVIGPFTSSWLIPLRGDDFRTPISYTNTASFNETRGVISKSIDSSKFFISGTKIESQNSGEKDETNDTSSLDLNTEIVDDIVYVMKIAKGESCTVKWTEDGNPYSKVFGPYTHDVHLYRTWYLMDDWDETGNITIQSPEKFWSPFSTRRSDVQITVDFNDMFVFYKGAVITDHNLEAMRMESDFNSNSGGDMMKKMSIELMFDAVQFRFERNDTPQYIPSIRGVEKKHVYLPRKSQIIFSSGERQSSKDVIVGPYSYDCQFRLADIGFTPKMYRLFEFGRGMITDYSRNEVKTVLQKNFFVNRDVEIMKTTGETVNGITGQWRGDDAKSIVLPRGTSLTISIACDVQLPSLSTDSNYGPFDYDTIIDLSDRFVNTPIRIVYETNDNHTPRQDMVVRNIEFRADGLFSYGIFEYTVRNESGTIEYKKHTETLTTDDTNPTFIEGSVFPDDFATLESVYLPANYSATIFTKTCVLELEPFQEHRQFYITGCTQIENIIIRHEPSSPFTVHTHCNTYPDDVDATTEHQDGVQDISVRGGEIVIIEPSVVNDNTETYGSIMFGPYLQPRKIDLSKSKISDIACTVQRMTDGVFYGNVYCDSVKCTESSAAGHAIHIDGEMFDLYESLSPTRIQGRKLERVEVRAGWLLTLFSEVNGTGFAFAFNAKENSIIDTTGSAFEYAKSYTATQIPEFLGDGVLSVRVNTQTMTTGDSWLVSNGIKNGLDSEIKPLVEKDFFEWNFDYGTNFFGFKVNDPEILRQARNNELVIDVRTPTLHKHDYKYSVSGHDWIMLYEFNTTENPMNDHYVPSGNVMYMRNRDGVPDWLPWSWHFYPQEIDKIIQWYGIKGVYKLIDRVHFDTIVDLARNRTLESTERSKIYGRDKILNSNTSTGLTYPMFLTLDFYETEDIDTRIGSIIYRLCRENDSYFYKIVSARTEQNGVIFGPRETDLVTIDVTRTSTSECSPAQWSNLRIYYIDSDFNVKFVDTDDIDIQNVDNPGGTNNTSDEYFEVASQLFDNDINTKWLDQRKNIGGSRLYRPRLTIPLKKSLRVIGIDADSANDHGSGTEHIRDPTIVRVNDDFTQVLLNSNVGRKEHMIYVRSDGEKDLPGDLVREPLFDETKLETEEPPKPVTRQSVGSGKKLVSEAKRKPVTRQSVGSGTKLFSGKIFKQR